MATYALADIHGQYNLLETILKWLKKDDTLIFLGDAFDRGPRPLDCFCALTQDPRVIYLKGNHEAFFRRFITFLLNDEAGGWMQTYAENGGKTSLMQLREYTDDEIIEIFYAIDRLKQTYDYVNPSGQIIHLCHAGYTPNFTEDLDFLWDREHFEDNWYGKENEFVVHGHTPTFLITTEQMEQVEPICYCSGHKFDIDLAAFATDGTCLLNLDDFSVTFFKEEPGTKEVNWWKKEKCLTMENVKNPKRS